MLQAALTTRQTSKRPQERVWEMLKQALAGCLRSVWNDYPGPGAATAQKLVIEDNKALDAW